MDKQGRYVDVKAADGSVLLSLFLPDNGIVLKDRFYEEHGRKQETGKKYGGNGRNGSNGEGMTFPQKRLLFRLIAERGFEGEAGKTELLKLFEADDLTDVGKGEASKMIERLLQEAKNGIPF